MTAVPPIRVLALVTDAFGGHGGIAQYNRDFLSALAQCESISDVVVLPRGGVASDEMLPAGIRQLGPVGGRLAYCLAALRLVRRQWPIHIIFCGHPFMAPLAATIAKCTHAKLWVQIHGIDAWQELPTVYRRAIEAADLITSVSRYTRRRLLQWCGINPRRVKVLPDTVQPRFVPGPKPEYLIERYGLRGKKVLITVARLASSERYKGHDRVIQVLPCVLARHPDVVYVVVGEGDDRPRIEAFATKLGVGDNVRFVGFVAADELPDHYRMADLVVMPSTGEGFGIAFLEAMAVGTPVIGGNRDGSLDPLADGTCGIAIDPESSHQLTEAIDTALAKARSEAAGVGRFHFTYFSKHLHDLVQSRLTPAATGA